MDLWGIEVQAAWRNDGFDGPTCFVVDKTHSLVAKGEPALLRKDPAFSHVNWSILPAAALPGLVNGHSHAFQYTLAGLAETSQARTRASSQPAADFWSWREAMYRVAHNLTPERMAVAAEVCYRELRRLGWTHVVEFQYVHHDPQGRHYREPACMGVALAQASAAAAINITLVPVYYQTSDFGQPIRPEQRRFASASLDEFWTLLAAYQDIPRQYPHARIGSAVHSLRAAPISCVQEFFRSAPRQGPRHIHVAEQPREVEACVHHTGQRPVEWMIDHVDASPSVCMVHATHLSELERQRLAQSPMSLILTPSTEGNLGDGRFPFWEVLADNPGRGFALGSDSHVGQSWIEDLRWLEYQERNTHLRRARCEGLDVGQSLLAGLLRGSREVATGQPTDTDTFCVGRPFNATFIDLETSTLAGVARENLASALIFAGHSRDICATYVAGFGFARAAPLPSDLLLRWSTLRPQLLASL